MVAIGLARAMPAGEAPSCLRCSSHGRREAREKRLAFGPNRITPSAPRAIPPLPNAKTPTIWWRDASFPSVNRGPTAYLDFGRDWRTDFTAVVSGSAGEALAARGVPGFLLARGPRVRLRGWIEQNNGPSLRITDPGQLELLDDGG